MTVICMHVNYFRETMRSAGFNSQKIRAQRSMCRSHHNFASRFSLCFLIVSGVDYLVSRSLYAIEVMRFLVLVFFLTLINFKKQFQICEFLRDYTFRAKPGLFAAPNKIQEIINKPSQIPWRLPTFWRRHIFLRIYFAQINRHLLKVLEQKMNINIKSLLCLLYLNES